MRALQGAIRLIARVETGSTHAVACLPAMPWERLLAGRPLQDIPRTLALLHPLAPQTHATAAQTALAAASGMRHVPAPEAHVALVREQAREHGIYFLMTLPEALGLAPDAALAQTLAHITAACDRDTLASSLQALLDVMAEASVRAAPGKNPVAPSSYPVLLLEELGARLPEGAPQRLASRVLARRWRALCVLPRTLDAKRWRSLRSGGASGTGWACLSSARGLLVHRLTLVDGQLAVYRLDTPTMRHFAPDGPWVRAMQSAMFQDTAAAQAAGALLAAVLDPCLPVIMVKTPQAAAPCV
jgi:hypothetical protein